MKNENKRKQTKYLHEGHYVAQVEIELIDSTNINSGWSPAMSLDTAYLLDDIRLALREGNIKRASQYARIFEMQQIA